MCRLFFLLSAFVLFTAGVKIGGNKDYSIISKSDYEKQLQNNKEVVLKKYIPIPEFDKNYKDILNTKDEKLLLAKFSFLLKKANIAWMDKYIRNCDNSLSINYLIKGMYYFSKKEYSQAVYYLKKLNLEEHAFLNALLLADCHFELLPNKKENLSVFDHYQTTMDVANSELEKQLVLDRIKYLKYY